MKRMLTVLAFGWSGLALCGAVLAAESDRPEPPGPGMMFQRLDRDGDGRVKLDEIPDAAPDFVKELLKRADKDQDGVVTLDEFRAAVPQMGPRAGGPPMGRGFGPPPGSPFAGRGRPDAARPDADRRPSGRPDSGRPDEARTRSTRPDADRSDADRRPSGRPDSVGRSASPRGAQPAPTRRPEPSAAVRSAGPPSPGTGGDPKAWFDRLDRDKDGKLSPDEFAAGMRMFHAGSMQPRQRPSGGDWSRGPRPGLPGSVGGRGPARPGAWPGMAWGRPPMMQSPWSGPHRGGAPVMRAPHARSPWARGPAMHAPWSGSPWGRGAMMHGQPHRGMRPSISPEQREEIAKRIQQARAHAEATWKKAMAMRDRARQDLVQKPVKAEAEVKKDEAKKTKVDDKADVKKEAAAKKAAADKKEAAAKKAAAEKKKAAEKKPAPKKP